MPVWNIPGRPERFALDHHSSFIETGDIIVPEGVASGHFWMRSDRSAHCNTLNRICLNYQTTNSKCTFTRILYLLRLILVVYT
jgi:hypothetical protein